MRSTRYALQLTGTYLVVACVYILMSGYLVAYTAESVADLRQAEMIKGIGFVVVTSFMLAVAAHRLFRRVYEAEQALARSRGALLEAERRSTAGLLAATVAHDFNNILSIVLGGLEVLRSREQRPDALKIIADMEAASQRATQLACELARSGDSAWALEAPRRLELGELVHEVSDLLRLHRSARGCRLTVDTPAPVYIRARIVLVHSILTNLLMNAVDAIPDGGRVQIRVATAGGLAVLEVHDDGPGVAVDQRSRIFEAFYTTKASGTGLGLLSVAKSAERLDGSVEVVDSPLGGACFRVTMPLWSETAPPVAPERASAEPVEV